MRPLVSLPDEIILMLLNKVRRDLTFHLIILNAKVFLQEARTAPGQASLMLSEVHVCIHNSIRMLSMDQCFMAAWELVWYYTKQRNIYWTTCTLLTGPQCLK